MAARGPGELFRATSIIARTVYRELRSAGHNEASILDFVNQVVALLTQDVGESTADFPEVVDPESGLTSREVILEVLDFEIRRARRKSRSLLALHLDLVVPNWCSDAVRRRAHDRLQQATTHLFRLTDAVGRISESSYLTVLPGASAHVANSLIARLGSALLEGPERLPEEVQVLVRIASSGPETESAADLLEQCMRIEGERLTAPSGAELRSQPARAQGRRVPSVPAGAQVTLALGGGAARAMAHIGVIRTLRRHGVSITGIAGTSAGALVGAMFASGLTEDEIVERFLAFPRSAPYRQIRRAFVRFRSRSNVPRSRESYFRESSMAFLSDTDLSAVTHELFTEFIRSLVGEDRPIESLGLPFAAAATDLIAGRSAVLLHGSLHRALRASCAIPGLFPPEPWVDRLLIDGSTMAEVPIVAGTNLGLQSPVCAIQLERPQRIVQDYGSTHEIAVRAAALVHTALVREQLRGAPLVISIPVQEVGWLDFGRAREIAAIGALFSEQAMPGLLARFEGAEPPSTEPRIQP